MTLCHVGGSKEPGGPGGILGVTLPHSGSVKYNTFNKAIVTTMDRELKGGDRYEFYLL